MVNMTVRCSLPRWLFTHCLSRIQLAAGAPGASQVGRKPSPGVFTATSAPTSPPPISQAAKEALAANPQPRHLQWSGMHLINPFYAPHNPAPHPSGCQGGPGCGSGTAGDRHRQGGALQGKVREGEGRG